MKRQYRFALDLQQFADGLIDFPEDGEEQDPDMEDTDDDDTELDADDFDFEDEPKAPDANAPKPTAFDEPEDEPDKPEPKSEDKPADEKPKDEKPSQSAEDNAKFAEQRRQKEAADTFKQSPEYKLAQTLADANGVSVPEMLQRVEDARLEAEAKKQNVPVDYLKEQQRLATENTQTRQELTMLQFQLWESRVNQETVAVKTEYPFLSDEDVEQAKEYMLTTLKNPEVSMEEVIHMVHGKKIAAGIKEAAKQEALAEMSGRKKAPLPPQGGKPVPSNGLTAAEKAMAKAMDMSEAEYAKYK